MLRRRLLALGLCVGSLGVAYGASALGPSNTPVPLVVVRNEGAEDCPDAPFLAESVNRRFRAPRMQAATSRRQDAWSVEVARHATGYRAVLQAAGGAREISDPSSTCSALGEALAVTLAVMLETVARETAPLVSSTAPTSPVLPMGAKAPMDEVLEAGSGVTLGLPRGATAALLAELRFLRGPWGAGAGALWVLPHGIAYGPGEVRIRHELGFARGCYSFWDWTSGRAQVCAGPTIGAVRGEGQGYLIDRRPSRLWFGLGAGLSAGGRIMGRLGWGLRAEALIPFRGQRFSVDGGGVAYESLPASLISIASISASIW